jgi:hypothetical protein
MMEPSPEGIEQITPRLRRCGNVYELDGEPLRKVVGRARTMDRLAIIDQLREDAIRLMGDKLPPPDASRVRKTVGKAQ